jgi:polyisoprenoid-binding protein YceI
VAGTARKESALVRLGLFWAIVFAALAPGGIMATGQTGPKPAASQITVHVHRSGLFSAFGHDHIVAAPIAQSKLDAKTKTVQIVVAAKQMKVVDTDVSEKDRAEIQATMLGPGVLNSDKFPEIRFQSSHVEEVGAKDGHRFRVTGNLALHGVTKGLTFDVDRNRQGQYHGKTKLKQTEFGIQPVSIAGGTVKVKDEVEIEFTIVESDLAHR